MKIALTSILLFICSISFAEKSFLLLATTELNHLVLFSGSQEIQNTIPTSQKAMLMISIITLAGTSPTL